MHLTCSGRRSRVMRTMDWLLQWLPIATCSLVETAGAGIGSEAGTRASPLLGARFRLLATIHNVLVHVAQTLGYFEPDIEPAITLIDRALDLNPSFAFGWYMKGWLCLWAGQADAAIELFEKSLRLNPLRKAPATFSIGLAHFFARRLEKAAAMLLVSLQVTPNWAPCLAFLPHAMRIRGGCEMHRQLSRS